MKLQPRFFPTMLFVLSFLFGQALHAATGQAIVVDQSIPYDGTAANLAAQLKSAGYTVTITPATVPASLTGVNQVWDLRYDQELSNAEITTYTAYLAAGGSLFLTGEHVGFMKRNNSIKAFIAALGGGSITYSAPLFNQTVQAPFNSPNSVTAITFRDCYGTTTAGTGSFITKDASNVGAAIVFGSGSLSAATAGALIVVWDVNFLDNARTPAESALSGNLISYFAARVASTPTRSYNTPVLTDWGLILLGAMFGLTSTLFLMKR